MNTQTRSTRSLPDRPRPPLAWVLASSVGTALATIIVLGTIAGRLGLPLGGSLLPLLGLLGLVPQLALLVRRQVAPRWPEMIVALIGAATVGGVGLWLAWPALLPIGGSGDAVLHTIHANWIYRTGALPPDTPEAWDMLGEMAVYPPGVALLTNAGARLTGLPPVAVIYPLIASIGGLGAALVLLLGVAAAGAPIRWRTTPLALAALPVLLAHHQFSLGAYIDQSYYPMALGVFLILLIGGWVVVEPGRTPFAAGQAGVALAALVLTYPLWAPVGFGMLLFGMWWGKPGANHKDAKGTKRGIEDWGGAENREQRIENKEHGTEKRIANRVLLVALALMPSMVMAAWVVIPRIFTGVALLEHPGDVGVPVAWDYLPLLLAVPGAVWAARRWRGRWLVVLLLLALGEMAGLTVAAQMGRSAAYHGYKVLFILTALSASLVGCAAVALATIGQLPVRLAAIGALAVVLLATRNFALPPPALQPVNPDMVAAADWLLANEPKLAHKAIAVGGSPGAQPYWMQLGLLGQPRDQDRTKLLAIAPPTPESWVFDEGLPSVAVALGTGTPPGSHVLKQFGSVAVLERDEPINLGTIDPLLIRYRTFWEDERLKTALEVFQPVAGRIPTTTLQVYHNGAPLRDFPLPPEQERTRMQYIGGDVYPDFAGKGYVNKSAFPEWGALAQPPTGAFSLTLRLSQNGTPVDERLLATFSRTADGQITNLAPHSGELVYARHEPYMLPPTGTAHTFGAGIRLSGWDAPETASAGQPYPVRLRWWADRLLDTNLIYAVQLRNATGALVADVTAPPQNGFYPTWRWRVGEPLDDTRTLMLPADLPPGPYVLGVAVRGPSGEEIAVLRDNIAVK